MKKTIRILQIGVLAAALLLSGAADQQKAWADACPPTLRFADTGVEGLEELRRKFGPFVEEMEKLTGSKVQFFPVGNRTAAVNALRFNQVDIIMAGPSEYVAIESRIPGNKPIVSLSRPSYASIFIVPADSPYRNVADLKDKRIALKDVGSTTGDIIPRMMLHNAGLNLDRDVRLLNVDGARFEALISGDVDAVGTGVRDWDRFEQRAGKGNYRILAQSERMPDDVILAGPHIGNACVDLVREQVMANGEALLSALLAPGELNKFKGAEWVPVSDGDYDVVREAYRVLGYQN